MISAHRLFFRLRDNAALVYRICTDTPSKRVEMEQIAVVHLNSGRIKPHGEHVLSDAETAEIEAWRSERLTLAAARARDDASRLIDQINHTTHWFQSTASDEDVDALFDDLIWSMHDLRQILIRKKSEKLRPGKEGKAEEG